MPRYVEEILDRLSAAGEEAYAVGGCVRDILLNRRPHDWDVTTSASCRKISEVFPHSVPTGEKYGTVTVLQGKHRVEVTTYRCETGYRDGRHPGQVAFTDRLTEDLKRRDFTVNAMAMNRKQEIIDCFGGREDLQKGRLRCVGRPEERFGEDALRMLRAVRFSAQLGFAIEEETARALRACAPLTEKLSAERIRDEMEKTLLSPAPERTGDFIALGLTGGRTRTGAMDSGALHQLGKLPQNARLRWAAFTALLLAEGWTESGTQFLRSLRLDRNTVQCTGRGAEEAQTSFSSDGVTLKRMAARLGPETALCAAAAAGPLQGFCRYRHLVAILRRGELCTLAQLPVTGGDLLQRGAAPGRALGKLLQELLDYAICHPEEASREALLAEAARRLPKPGVEETAL